MSAKQTIRALAGAAFVALGVLAAPASATFPGVNGQITFFRADSSDGSAEIWRADADGNNQVKLTDSGANHASVESDWAPSGERIAFDSDRSGDVQVYTMDRDGGTVAQITTGAGFHGDPAYSPDGNSLAIESDLGNPPADEGIYIVPSTGGPYTITPAMKVTGIPGNATFVSEPQFSPNGQWIAFTAFKNCAGFADHSHHPQPTGCTSAIYRVHPDGSALTRLTPWGENASYPDWSPNGQWISHDSGDNGKFGQHGGIWLMRPDGSNDHEIVGGSPITSKNYDFYNNAVFSPDGTAMIFTHFLPDTSDLVRATSTGGSLDPIIIGDETNFQNRTDWGPAPAE